MGKLIELGEYYERAKPSKLEIEFNSGDADEDKLLCVEALKAWARMRMDMDLKHPMLYGMIWSYMSPESVNEVKNQKGGRSFQC